MASTRSMRSVESSFYTAPLSPSSTDELSSIINLNGKSYHLTVYHKKPDSDDWKEITQSYLKLSSKSDFQKLLQQQIKVPCEKIEIITSISPNTNSSCKIQESGATRKIPFILTESQSSKIFAVLGNLKSIEQSKKSILGLSSSLFKESSGSAPSIKMSLEEIKKSRVSAYVEQIAIPNTKPMGFKNKSMNCGFNSCLQMIVNEPLLYNIYTTVATYYAKSAKAEDKECGERMLSILNSYDQAVEEQKPISEEVSNSLRLAMHYLNPKEISSGFSNQEDANAILMVLFLKYEYIVTENEIIDSLQEYQKAFKSQNPPLKIPSNLEPILSNKNITEELLNEIIQDRRKFGEENLLNKSPIYCKIEHIVYHKIEKTIQKPPNEDYSTLNEDNTFIQKHVELDLKIKFPTGLGKANRFFSFLQKDFTLTNLLQDHFHNKHVKDSHTRKFMKGNDCIEASIMKEELKFSKLPKCLFINLERFVPNLKDRGKPTKLTSPVEIPEELDARLLNIQDSPPGSYELSSFIVHLGSSSNGGHYIAYRKVQDRWVECDNERISYISKKQMLEAAKNSYICFYRLKDLPIPQLPI